MTYDQWKLDTPPRFEDPDDDDADTICEPTPLADPDEEETTNE